jgi:hypothetical protein
MDEHQISNGFISLLSEAGEIKWVSLSVLARWPKATKQKNCGTIWFNKLLNLF